MNIFQVLSDGELEEVRRKPEPSEELVRSLIDLAFDNDFRLYAVKAFVWSLLTISPTRNTAKSVFQKLFSRSLKVARDSMKDQPDHGNHITAFNNCEILLWLVDRMNDLWDAGYAVEEWSVEASFAANLQRTFKEDQWRKFKADLANLVLTCSSKLAGLVADGSDLVSWKVKKQLVENWLPVLNARKDNANAPHLIFDNDPKLHESRTLHLDLEKAFSKIRLTLPKSSFAHYY